MYLQPDISYINPQFHYFGTERTDLRHLVGPRCEDATSNTSRLVDWVMDCLDSPTDDSTTAVWSANRLQLMLDQCLVGTKLKDHQVQGVQFIIGRENPDVAVKIKKKMLMFVDRGLTLHPENLGLGGIIADAMGLGKTLTILTAIFCSRQLRRDSGAGESHIDAAEQSNLTLIVLPSRQMLDVWKNEIDQRFRPQTFNTQIFHGETRAKDKDQLLDSDIVLTTYHTLEKNSHDKGILGSIKWLRIVLDEGKFNFLLPHLLILTPKAHYIRNSSIKIHKAAVALKRTPIQNSLDDLRSLFQFFKFEPFCQNKVFEHYIAKLFGQNSNESCEAFNPSRNLKIIMKACCLRRTQERLNLPPTNICKVLVTPTDVEKAMFKTILDECREEFSIIAGKGEGAKKSNTLFSTIMKLRRVCNHGSIRSDATAQEWPKHPTVSKMEQNASHATSPEPICDLCSNPVMDNDFIGEYDSCPLCGRILSQEYAESSSAVSSPFAMSSPAESAMDLDMMSPEPSNNGLCAVASGNNLTALSSKMSAVVENIKGSCFDKDSKRYAWQLLYGASTNKLTVLCSPVGEIHWIPSRQY
ncbi:hypothetical protein SNK04_004526 [Fusarium graminearum]